MFVQTLYDYNFVWPVTECNSDDGVEMAIGMVSDSHPHDDQQLVGYSDFIGEVTEEDNSDEEDEMEIAESESLSPHGDQQLVSYTDSDSDGSLNINCCFIKWMKQQEKVRNDENICYVTWSCLAITSLSLAQKLN